MSSIEQMKQALKRAADKFDVYHQHHLLKKDYTKAMVNGDMRDDCLKAIVGFKFEIGEEVCSVDNSAWRGRVVGMYSTQIAPEGYVVKGDMLIAAGASAFNKIVPVETLKDEL